MKKAVIFSIFVLFTTSVVIFWNLLSSSIVAQETLTVLAGRSNSFYYQGAIELKEALNKNGFTLNIQESPGSFQNLKALGAGKADLAFAQQDALVLLGSLSDKEQARLADNIEVFAPLNKEAVHVIANTSAKINSFADLVGKDVGIGPEGSGTYVSAIALYQLNNIDVTREHLMPLEISDEIEKVKTHELDAAFYTANLGVPLLKNISAKEGLMLKLIPINIKNDDGIYSSDKVSVGTYPWQTKEINTVSTFSFLYTNKLLDTQKVYRLARAAYTRAAQLKAKNNEFWTFFDVSEAKRKSFSKVDYHPAVKRFLEEQ